MLKGFKISGSNREVYILDDIEPIMTSLDDSLSTVTVILASRFVAPLRGKAESLRKDFLLL